MKTLFNLFIIFIVVLLMLEPKSALVLFGGVTLFLSIMYALFYFYGQLLTIPRRVMTWMFQGMVSLLVYSYRKSNSLLREKLGDFYYTFCHFSISGQWNKLIDFWYELRYRVEYYPAMNIRQSLTAVAVLTVLTLIILTL